jgi:hypothetical protein
MKRANATSAMAQHARSARGVSDQGYVYATSVTREPIASRSVTMMESVRGNLCAPKKVPAGHRLHVRTVRNAKTDDGVSIGTPETILTAWISPGESK